MRNERRVLRNAGLLTLGEAAGQLANLLFVVSFARTYGVAALGQYSLGMATGAVAGLAVSFGTQNFLLRELSQHPALTARRIATLAPWHVAAAALIAALTSLVLAGREAGTLVLLVAVGYQLVYRAGGLYYVAFRAAERMIVPVAADLGQRALTLLLGGALMFAGATATVTACAMLVSATMFATLGRHLMQREFGRLERVPAREVLQILRASWPFFGTLALGVLYARGAPILLGLIRGAESVGGYAAADRLLVVATLIPAMYASAAIPALSRIAQHELEALRALATRLLRILLLVALTTAGLIAAFAQDLVHLLFGPQYAHAAVLLQILAIAIPVQATEQLLAALLSAVGLQHLLLRTRLASLLAFAVAGSVAVYQWGAAGLAASVVGCSVLQLGGCIFHLARRRELPLAPLAVFAPALSAGLAAATALLLAGQALLLRAFCFGVVLLVAGMASGAVRVHDFSFARALLRREPAVRDSDREA
ncbi:MAG: oligosaccharide flippase family protein [Steroidobacteraceae bacterium]